MNEILLSPVVNVYVPLLKKNIRLKSEQPVIFSESSQDSSAGRLIKCTMKVVVKTKDAEFFRSCNLGLIITGTSNTSLEYICGTNDYPATYTISGGLPFVTLAFEAQLPML